MSVVTCWLNDSARDIIHGLTVIRCALAIHARADRHACRIVTAISTSKTVGVRDATVAVSHLPHPETEDSDLRSFEAGPASVAAKEISENAIRSPAAVPVSPSYPKLGNCLVPAK